MKNKNGFIKIHDMRNFLARLLISLSKATDVIGASKLAKRLRATDQLPAFTTIFEGLPVVLLDSWTEVSEKFLLDKSEEVILKKFDFFKLYLAYWRNKIHGLRKFTRDDITISKHRELSVGSSH
jgi:hypothetical protein